VSPQGAPTPWTPSAALGGLVRRGRAVHLAGTSAGLDACVGAEAVDARVPLLPVSVADVATAPVDACPPGLLAAVPWYAPVPAQATPGMRVVAGTGPAAATGLVVHPSSTLCVVGEDGERVFVHQLVVELDAGSEAPPSHAVGWVCELGTARPVGLLLAVRGRRLAVTHVADVLDALGATLLGPDLPSSAPGRAEARAVPVPLRPALPVVDRRLAQLRRTWGEPPAADAHASPRRRARRLSP
jgi:hypothetical protein